MSAETEARYSEAGRIAARARWGPPRIVRLDSLTPEAARLVRALVDAASTEKADTAIVSPVPAEEARRVRDEPTT